MQPIVPAPAVMPMNPIPTWILPAWVDVADWKPRFESTLYYGLSCGKRLLDHAKGLAANLPADSPLASSPEFVLTAAVSAARRINGVCLCVAADKREQAWCKEQCKRLCSLTRVPEALFAPLGNELMQRTFGTNDIPAISKKLREYTLVKLP